jgi:hypothetical protein
MAQARPRPSCIAVTLAVCLYGMAALALPAAAATASTHHRPHLPAAALTDDDPAAEQLVPDQTPDFIPIAPHAPAPATTPLPAVLTTPSPARQQVVITPTEAQQIVAADWTLRDEAFTYENKPLLPEFETGPALESDEVTCGCTSRAPRGPIESESLFVPRQRSYPATFMAEVQTTFQGDPYHQFLIVARDSAHNPWLVVSDPGEESTTPLDTAKLNANGFDVSPPPPRRAAAHLPAQLAAYWQAWTDAGQAPKGISFAPGAYTTQYGATLADQPQGSLYQHNGLEGWSVNQPGRDLWSFGTTTGGLTCGVVRTQYIWTAPDGIYQDPMQNNWGPTVAPGVYRLEAETDIEQPCFEEQAGHPPAVISGELDPDTEQGITPIPLVPGTQA